MKRIDKYLLIFSTIVLANLGSTEAISAQSIQGQVVDRVDQRPLASTFVFLVDAAGNDVANAIADIQGNFELVGQGPGEYGVRAEMRGYRGSISALFQLQPEQELTLRLLLVRESTESVPQGAVVPVPSRPPPDVSTYGPAGVEVTAEGATSLGALAEFNERRDRGVGRFTTRPEFTSTGNPMSVTDVLQRMRGVDVEGALGGRRVSVTQARGGQRTFGLADEQPEYCPPLFFRDRRFLGNGENIDIDAAVPLEEVLAIEVHGNTGTLPGTYTRGGSQCGVIAIWTPNARAIQTVAATGPASDRRRPGESAAFPSRALNTVGSIWSSTVFQFLAAMGMVVVVFVTVGKSIHF